MTQTTTEQARPKTAKPKRNEIQDLPAAQRTLGLNIETEGVSAPVAALTPIWIPLEKLHLNPTNRGGKYDQDKIEQYARTIKVAQEEPIKVFPADESGSHRIHDGGHRYLAAKKAGVTGLLAIVRKDFTEGTEAEQAASRLVHNTHAALTPYMEALEYGKMKTHGYSNKQVATRAGVSEDVVGERLRLLELPPDVGTRIGEPGFGLGHAEAILPLVQHPKLFEAAKTLITKPKKGEERLSADDFARRLGQTLAEKKLVATRGPYDWSRQQVMESKPFVQRVQALPKVNLGTHVVILDREGYAAIEAEAQKVADQKAARATAKATPGAKQDPKAQAARKKELFEAKVKRLTRQRITELAAKTCRATTTVHALRLYAFAVSVKIKHTYLSAPKLGLLAALTDPVVTKDEWTAWHNEYDSKKKAKLEDGIVNKFAKDGYEHLLSALLTVDAFGDKADDPREWLDAAGLLGVAETQDAIEKKVRAELEAAPVKARKWSRWSPQGGPVDPERKRPLCGVERQSLAEHKDSDYTCGHSHCPVCAGHGGRDSKAGKWKPDCDCAKKGLKPGSLPLVPLPEKIAKEDEDEEEEARSA